MGLFINKLKCGISRSKSDIDKWTVLNVGTLQIKWSNSTDKSRLKVDKSFKLSRKLLAVKVSTSLQQFEGNSSGLFVVSLPITANCQACLFKRSFSCLHSMTKYSRYSLLCIYVTMQMVVLTV